jgi:hypothetical protein
LKWFSSVTPDEYQDNTNKTAALKTVPLNNFGIKLEVMPYYSNIYIKTYLPSKFPMPIHVGFVINQCDRFV